MHVVAIVCAYNEAPRIGRVLEVLLTYPGFSKIIAVDDGSTDGTADIGAQSGAQVIRLGVNKGKGEAMQAGVEATDAEVFFFCDADIVGLTHDIIQKTLQPVLTEEKDMFIAARAEKERRYLGFTYSPLFDGQRAVRRELWEQVPARYKKAFAIEAALNHIAIRSPRGLGYALYPITQTRKEEKQGYWKGSLARLDMCSQIVATKISLYV